MNQPAHLDTIPNLILSQTLHPLSLLAGYPRTVTLQAPLEEQFPVSCRFSSKFMPQRTTQKVGTTPQLSYIRSFAVDHLLSSPQLLHLPCSFQLLSDLTAASCTSYPIHYIKIQPIGLSSILSIHHLTLTETSSSPTLTSGTGLSFSSTCLFGSTQCVV